MDLYPILFQYCCFYSIYFLLQSFYETSEHKCL